MDPGACYPRSLPSAPKGYLGPKGARGAVDDFLNCGRLRSQADRSASSPKCLSTVTAVFLASGPVLFLLRPRLHPIKPVHARPMQGKEQSPHRHHGSTRQRRKKQKE